MKDEILTKTKRPTKAERRLAVVKDVLARAKKQEDFSGYGNFLVKLPHGVNKNESAQKYIKEIQKKCEACALGTCLVSFVKLENKTTLKELGLRYDYWRAGLRIDIDSNVIIKKLSRLFSPEQLWMIEVTFEGFDENSGAAFRQRVFKYNEKKHKAKYEKCMSFRLDYDNRNNYDNKGLLIAIMKNMVANKGVFKP